MKRRYQRFIPCLLCVALLVFLFAVPVNAAETSGACGENATWTLVDGVLTISGTGKTWDFRDDASRFDYHPCPWEEIKDEIREVIVEEGITYLGAGAFTECANLERVSLPESLTVLESLAISYCRRLSECELPSHLEYLGQENFKWSAIKHATIPASVTFLDGGVYTCCRQLESVYIEGDPDLQGFICGPGSFTACPALSAIEVSEDHIALCSVDGVLFNKKCTTLYAYPEGHKGSSYRIPTGTTEIFQSAFDFDRSVDVEHPEIELLIVPASVTDILGIFNDFRRIGAVRFEGDAPSGVEDALKIGYTYEETMTVYYPKDNPTWAEVIAKTEGDGKFTWVPEESLAITAQPESVTAAPGDSVNFTVAASGTDLSYQWQYSSDNGETWKNSPATGNTTAMLTVPATASRSGNQYRCVVKSGSDEVTSDAATLTVETDTAPVITKQPESVTVTAGGSVNITVAASGDDLSYQWEVSADGGKTWKNSPVTGNTTATLTVPATTSRNGNMYRCVVKSGSAEVTSDAATLTVKSDTKPTITTQPKSVTAVAGDSVKFTVKASGTDLKYQWQYSTDSGKTWKASPATGNKTATLKVSATASRSGYKYRCVVKSGTAKATSKAATLTVLSITTQPKSVTAVAGDSVKFTVKASGTDLSYQWQVSTDGGKTWKASPVTGNKTATLKVPATEDRSGNQYRCVVKSGTAKATSKAATLTVEPGIPPTIISQPESVTVSFGNNAEFTVVASGTNLSYQWQVSEDGGTTWKNVGSIYTGNQSAQLTKPATSDGIYRCVVKSGSFQVISSEAILTVRQKFEIKKQPESITAAEGSTVELTIEATGLNISYQWQYSRNGGKTWNDSSATGNKTPTLELKATMDRDGMSYHCVVTEGDRKRISDTATLTVLNIFYQPKSVLVPVGTTVEFSVGVDGNSAKTTYQWQYSNDEGKTWKNSPAEGNQTSELKVQATAVRNGYRYRCVVKEGDAQLISNAAVLTVYG